MDPGDTIEVSAHVINEGGRPAQIGPAKLCVPGYLSLVETPEPVTRLEPGAEAVLRRQLEAVKPGAGAVSLSIPVAGAPTLVGSRRLHVSAGEPTDALAELRLGDARIVALGGGGNGALGLDVATGDGTWARIATIPSIGSVVVETDSGGIDTVEFAAVGTPRRPETRDGVRLLSASATDLDGRNWTADLTLLPAGAPLFDTRLEVRCDSDATIRRIDGPTILMEPCDDEDKLGGMFGGLEWLEGAERSWNEAADRSRLRIRYRPHVNRIAVPVMVLAQSGGQVGWLWDPGDEAPGALFGAPTEEMTGRADSEMGLFRPAIRQPDGENDDFGMEPLELAAGERVTINAHLLLGRATSDMADPCRLWVDRFGLPAPEPFPRGGVSGELAFTMRAFLESLWVEEENGWQNGVGPARNVGRYGPFLTSVLLGGRWLEGNTGAACRDLLARTQGPPEGFRGAELPWYEGSLIKGIQRDAGGCVRSLNEQNADGGWTFEGWVTLRRLGDREKLADLGDLDRSEVGFGASYAAALLRLARLTGDETARSAGMKALAWLDTFLVPRAAQCWEVPAHAPDIVAAADAIRAFVEAYWLTGDRAYRDKAEAWANRGIPFIYLWNDPAMPEMLYGSTPVLGATWYTGFWYGRPVQWCGLNYACALSWLIEAGVEEPWSALRLGLLSSGALQQYTEPHRVALIPDSIDLTANALGADYWVPPYTQAMALAHCLGSLPSPQTAVAGGIRVSAMGEVTAALADGNLSVTVEFPEPGAHHILVAGVGEVGGVSANGQSLARNDDLTAGDGWTGNFARGVVEIRLETAQKAELVLTGCRTKSVKLLGK